MIPELALRVVTAAQRKPTARRYRRRRFRLSFRLNLRFVTEVPDLNRGIWPDAIIWESCGAIRIR